MAFFLLFLFLLLLCFPVRCCFVAPLEEKELLRSCCCGVQWRLVLREAAGSWGESGGVRRKPTMPRGGQEGGGVLPNGGGSEQRERLQSFSSPLFSSFNCHFLSFKTFPLF
jgi:hypothetical protein